MTRLLWQGNGLSTDGTPWLKGLWEILRSLLLKSIWRLKAFFRFLEFESILNPDTRSMTITVTIETEYGSANLGTTIQWLHHPFFEWTPKAFKLRPILKSLNTLRLKRKRFFGSDINLDADTQDGQLLISLHRQSTMLTLRLLQRITNSTPIRRLALVSWFCRKNERHYAKRCNIFYGRCWCLLVKPAPQSIMGWFRWLGNNWMLPSQVIILVSGQITSRLAENVGALKLRTVITTIETPATRGWQSVTNPQSATLVFLLKRTSNSSTPKRFTGFAIRLGKGSFQRFKFNRRYWVVGFET